MNRDAKEYYNKEGKLPQKIATQIMQKQLKAYRKGDKKKLGTALYPPRNRRNHGCLVAKPKTRDGLNMVAKTLKEILF